MNEEQKAWRAFIKAAHHWASNHMVEWEMVKFDTPHGTIYLTLTQKPGHPSRVYDPVDAEGQALGLTTTMQDTP